MSDEVKTEGIEGEAVDMQAADVEKADIESENSVKETADAQGNEAGIGTKEAADMQAVTAEEDTEVIDVKEIKRSFSSKAQEAPKRRPLVGVEDKKVETKRILLFLLLCFGVTWLVELSMITPLYKSGNSDAVREAVDLISQMMFAPAIAALIARLLTREGLVKSGFQFNFSQHKFLFLFSWFGMTALTYLGAIVYFVVFRGNFDPNMTEFVSAYNSSAAEPMEAVNIVAAFKTDLLMKLFTAPVLDIINSFGEEWGFRAYLMPKLYRKIGAIPAMIVSGLASGLWYAPLVALGYYYGGSYRGFPVTGILAMCVFSMVTGIIYSFLCLRTGSIFPSVFAHSAVNVMMSQAAMFTFDGGNYFTGPAPTGILGGLPFVLAAVACIVYMYQHPVKAGAEE
ncbi:MAG: CPBP family intramembrane metalloprotease [Roseburia sp.]|nr:CPBP family intramembrane metalloprotease [Roseburia sp.]